MPSPMTRTPDELVNAARRARPELAKASIPMIVRVALAYLAGGSLPDAIERGRKPVKSGPKPKPKPANDS